MSLDIIKNKLPSIPFVMGVAIGGVSYSLMASRIEAVCSVALVSGTVGIIVNRVAKKMCAWGITIIAHRQLAEVERKIFKCRETLLLHKLAKEATQNVYGKELVFQIVPYLQFGAACSNTGEISISAHLSERKMMGAAIFELANMSQSLKIRKLHDSASRGEISQEMFARRCEEIEFESARIATRVIRYARWQCSEDWENVPKNTYEEIEELPDNESRFRWVEENAPNHIGFYRLQWGKLQKAFVH